MEKAERYKIIKKIVYNFMLECIGNKRTAEEIFSAYVKMNGENIGRNDFNVALDSLVEDPYFFGQSILKSAGKAYYSVSDYKTFKGHRLKVSSDWN